MQGDPKPRELFQNIMGVLNDDQKSAFKAKLEAKLQEFGEKHPAAAAMLEKLKQQRGATGAASGTGSTPAPTTGTSSGQ